ncbi:T9SS type A sorting domain-containing protein [Flavobacterium sp. 1355]|uniref:NHL domain-containing protein n=1 Tax=Flavobacterium sp. 1355 TaxID=2806571 RepID=UPI001AE9EF5B|nr:T9SS type A sorting domain-containing protein [Flavobacterium sp. 1355]MBP1221895.1 sugar lactone lactonase YvrE [Flavobacterium sp. 1355]
MKQTLILLFILSSLFSSSQTVSTFAGGGRSLGNFSEGIGTGPDAQFTNPEDLCSDAAGNFYVADTYNHRIRKISPDGFVTTIAGSLSGYADGKGTAAQFNRPSGICIDTNGNLYVADSENNKIRKITSDGSVTTLAGSVMGKADGNGAAAKFSIPYAICIDPTGNLYVSDSGNGRIRKITLSGNVTTIAPSQDLHIPRGICVDKTGNLYITSLGSDAIYKITPAEQVTIIAGSVTGYADGTGTAAKFHHPIGIDIDANGNLFVADMYNDRIRKITPDGAVTSFAGFGSPSSDDLGAKAGFYDPHGLHVHSDGNIYVADASNNKIRKISPEGVICTFAGSGPGADDGLRLVAEFSGMYGMCTDPSGNIYVVDQTNFRIRKITPEGVTSTLAGHEEGYADGTGPYAKFSFPNGICSDAAGNIYVTDAGNYKIRKITPQGVVTTLAGSTVGFADGPGSAAKFNTDLDGICADKSGNLYVADNYNHKIRKITPNGTVSTFAGSTFGFEDGPASTAKIWQPKGICIDKNGNLYVSDRFNHRIRKITPNGTVSTLAGSTEGYTDGPGASAQFSYPEQIGIDSNDNLYVTDYSLANHIIRKISPSGTVSTLAGSTDGYLDGPALSAKFSNPRGICADAKGNIYVADLVNSRIRKITQETLSVDEILYSKSNWKAFPNPANDKLNIELEGSNDAEVIVTDILGQKVFSSKIEGSSITVDTQRFAAGIYFVTLKDKAEKSTKKIIIE